MEQHHAIRECRGSSVIRQIYLRLLDVISTDICGFSAKFLQNGFITWDAKMELSTTLGVGDKRKAGQLLDIVHATMPAGDKQEWFDNFISIFSVDAAYQELAEDLKKEYESVHRERAEQLEVVYQSGYGRRDDSLDALRFKEPPVADFAKQASTVAENEVEQDVCYACEELVESYESRLRRDFSDLMYSSVEALKQKLRKKSDRKRFIQDIVRQYRIRKVETMSIRKIMDTLCENEKWGLQRYQGLFSILEHYVDRETVVLRDNYKGLVTGWYEVRSLSDRRMKNKYAHTVEVRYNVPPGAISTIKRLWEDISERFNLPPLEALLYDKRYSSLILTWLINADEETSALIRNLLIENMPANIPFLKENNITHIIYDFEVLYPTTGETQDPDGPIMLFIKSEIQYVPLSLFNLYLRSTVQELKGSLVQQWGWLRILKYHLLFQERILENHRLRHYGIEDQSVIHLKISPFESGQPPPLSRQGAYNVTDSEIDDSTEELETGNDEADSVDGAQGSSVTRGDLSKLCSQIRRRTNSTFFLVLQDHCHPDTHWNIPTKAPHQEEVKGSIMLSLKNPTVDHEKFRETKTTESITDLETPLEYPPFLYPHSIPDNEERGLGDPERGLPKMRPMPASYTLQQMLHDVIQETQHEESRDQPNQMQRDHSVSGFTKKETVKVLECSYPKPKLKKTSEPNIYAFQKGVQLRMGTPEELFRDALSRPFAQKLTKKDNQFEEIFFTRDISFMENENAKVLIQENNKGDQSFVSNRINEETNKLSSTSTKTIHPLMTSSIEEELTEHPDEESTSLWIRHLTSTKPMTGMAKKNVLLNSNMKTLGGKGLGDKLYSFSLKDNRKISIDMGPFMVTYRTPEYLPINKL